MHFRWLDASVIVPMGNESDISYRCCAVIAHGKYWNYQKVNILKANESRLFSVCVMLPQVYYTFDSILTSTSKKVKWFYFHANTFVYILTVNSIQGPGTAINTCIVALQHRYLCYSEWHVSVNHKEQWKTNMQLLCTLDFTSWHPPTWNHNKFRGKTECPFQIKTCPCSLWNKVCMTQWAIRASGSHTYRWQVASKNIPCGATVLAVLISCSLKQLSDLTRHLHIPPCCEKMWHDSPGKH